MDTNAINPAAQSTLDRLNTPSRVTGGGFAELDETDFLRLLTTQLTYQDPLEPVSNEDMLAQLAQFSSLEAANASSDTLSDISAKLDQLIAATEAAVPAPANSPAPQP